MVDVRVCKTDGCNNVLARWKRFCPECTERMKRESRVCKTKGCNNHPERYKTYCSTCIWKREAVKHSCRVCFNVCIDCHVLFTAKTKRKKRCDACNEQTVKNRKIKGLVELKRTCMNPACGKPFVTYNKNCFACDNKKCQDIVANIRRQYNLKMRRFLGLCVHCGAEANGNTLCDRCQKRAIDRQSERRETFKNNNLCQECGKNIIEDGCYCCTTCLEKIRARKIKRKVVKICISDDCENESMFGSQFCKDCFDRREAAKHVCKVYFRECCNCSKLFTSKNKGTKYCSNTCLTESSMVKPINRICTVCGKEYEIHRGINFDNTCSIFCREKVIRNDKRNAKHKRRVRLQSLFIEKVRIDILFERDCERCQICNRKLNLKRKVPHPLAATVDHIIPLSKGGEHSYRNTQLACFRCNSRKGNRPVAGGEQLLLFG